MTGPVPMTVGMLRSSLAEVGDDAVVMLISRGPATAVAVSRVTPVDERGRPIGPPHVRVTIR